MSQYRSNRRSESTDYRRCFFQTYHSRGAQSYSQAHNTTYEMEQVMLIEDGLNMTTTYGTVKKTDDGSRIEEDIDQKTSNSG